MKKIIGSGPYEKSSGESGISSFGEMKSESSLSHGVGEDSIEDHDMIGRIGQVKFGSNPSNDSSLNSSSHTRKLKPEHLHRKIDFYQES
jgi:hypothetical protein